MVKKFALVSFGVLCLMVSALIGFHIGNQSAEATVITDPVGAVVAMSEQLVMTVDGKLWIFNDNRNAWEEWVGSPIPMPTSQAQFFDKAGDEFYLVDKQGNVWIKPRANSHWVNRGQPPAPPVSTSPETWGGVKSNYDGDK